MMTPKQGSILILNGNQKWLIEILVAAVHI